MISMTKLHIVGYGHIYLKKAFHELMYSLFVAQSALNLVKAEKDHSATNWC